MQKYKKITWVVLLSYIVFDGCFIFPFSNELFPFDYETGMMIITCYGVIGFFFVILLEQRRSFRVFIVTLVFTILGLVCRYFLEFGEVSNTRDFSLINIILFIVIIPTLCTGIYWVIHKSFIK